MKRIYVNPQKLEDYHPYKELAKIFYTDSEYSQLAFPHIKIESLPSRIERFFKGSFFRSVIHNWVGGRLPALSNYFALEDDLQKEKFWEMRNIIFECQKIFIEKYENLYLEKMKDTTEGEIKENETVRRNEL